MVFYCFYLKKQQIIWSIELDVVNLHHKEIS